MYNYTPVTMKESDISTNPMAIMSCRLSEKMSFSFDYILRWGCLNCMTLARILHSYDLLQLINLKQSRTGDREPQFTHTLHIWWVVCEVSMLELDLLRVKKESRNNPAVKELVKYFFIFYRCNIQFSVFFAFRWFRERSSSLIVIRL